MEKRRRKDDSEIDLVRLIAESRSLATEYHIDVCDGKRKCLACEIERLCKALMTLKSIHAEALQLLYDSKLAINDNDTDTGLRFISTYQAYKYWKEVAGIRERKLHEIPNRR